MRIVGALPLALPPSGPRGPLGVAALGEMKRPLTDAGTEGESPSTTRMARMRRSPGGRSQVIYVRVTGAEDRQIRDRAAAQGLSAQRLLVESTLSGSAENATARRHAGVDLRAARVILKGMANNLNQLTKWANANHALPGGLGLMTDDVRRAVAAMERTTSGLGMAFAVEKLGTGEGQETGAPS
jgi:hypothetical protein